MADQRVVEIEPNRKQMEFFKSRTRHTGYGGARGGGKSWVVRRKAEMLANRYGRPDKWSQGIRICIVRRTLEDLKKNHLDALKLEIGNAAVYNTTEKRFTFRNGSTIQLAYCDNDKDADHFQGVEYDVIFIEEATQLKEEWIKKIAASCRGVNEFPHRVYYTCNPGGPGHKYIRRVFVDRLFQGTEHPEDYRFIQAKVTDNKVLMEHSPEYVNFLLNLPPKTREAWLEGSWDIYEGQYFSEFVNDPDHYEDRRWTHVIDPIPIRKHWPIFRGFDWGHYRPFSVGWYAIDDDGTMYRFRELYGVQKSGTESIADKGVEWPAEKIFVKIREIEDNDPILRGKQITGIADPAIFKRESNGYAIADEGMAHGIYFEAGDNSRVPGWMQCRYRLQFNEYGIPRFQVFRNCTEFIRTITQLEHDEHDVEDVNSTGEDHAGDEWRYVCNWRGTRIKAYLEAPKFDPMWGADPLGTIYGGGR